MYMLLTMYVMYDRTRAILGTCDVYEIYPHVYMVETIFECRDCVMALVYMPTSNTNVCMLLNMEPTLNENV